MNQSKSEWFLLSFLMLIIAVIFWQINTVMTEAGMASGGALDNAAAYPKALAIIMGILIAIRIITKIRTNDKKEDSVDYRSLFSNIKRSALLLAIFTIYLLGLKTLGYHLMTPIFLVSILYVVGERKWLYMIRFGVLSSLTVSFLFEVLLKIVLPGGIFYINIPW